MDALVKVEGLDASDCGLLSFGIAAGDGAIFVERGRICWAAARGLRRRLRELLGINTRIRASDLDAVYERCRVEGRPFGQTLVEDGWISADELETVMRRHSAESLVELSQSPHPTIWSSRGQVGYSPRFTFRPLDVLLDVAEVVAPTCQANARDELAAFQAPGRFGGAFLLDGTDHDGVVPVAGFGDRMTVHALRILGRWARSVLAATRELGETPSFTLAATAAGDTISVWWRDGLLFAVACEDRTGVAMVTGQHLAVA